MARQQLEGIKKINQTKLIEFINDNISEFHENKLISLKRINIDTIIKQ